tara:strand:+ start:2087 stop:4531 length:2445 start_codon:yes stop_codon:yes gene_type:complete
MAAKGATEVERLVVRLLGDGSGYARMLKGAVAGTKAAAAKMKSAGLRMSTALTLPLAIMGGLAVKSFADFDQAMTESTSIMGNLSDTTTKSMRNLALELSGKGIQAPKELADSYFFLASAGLSAEQSMAALPAVMDFATAGAFDMSTATDLLTDAQSALGMSSKDAAENLENMTRISDVLVKANTIANASVQQFSEALTADAATAAQSMGIELETTVAILGVYADKGKKAAEAGNLFGRATRLLSSAFEKNGKVFKKHGINVIDEATGEYRNFIDILEDMNVAFKDMTGPQKKAALSQLGFKALAQKSILPLLGQTKALKANEKALKATGAITKEVAAKQMKSFTNQMKLFKNQITAVGIGVGEMLAPALLKVTGFITKGTDAWKRLSPEIQRTVVYTLAAVAAIGPLIFILGSLLGMVGAVMTGLVSFIALVVGAFGALLSAIMFLFSPLGILIAAITALVAWLIYATVTSEEFVQAWAELGGIGVGGIVDAIKAGDIELAWEIVQAALKVAWLSTILFVQNKWIGFTDFFAEIFLRISANMQKAFISVKEFIVKAYLTIFSTLLTGWLQIATKIKESLKFLAKAISVMPGFGDLGNAIAAGLDANFNQVEGQVEGIIEGIGRQKGFNERDSQKQRDQVDTDLDSSVEESRKMSQRKTKGVRDELKAAQDALASLNKKGEDKLKKKEFWDNVLAPIGTQIGATVSGAYKDVFDGGPIDDVDTEGGGGGGGSGLAKFDRSAGEVSGTRAGGLAAMAALSRQSDLFAATGSKKSGEADPKADTQNLADVKTNTDDMAGYLQTIADQFTVLPAGVS